MNVEKYADLARVTLGLDVFAPAFAVVTFAMIAGPGGAQRGVLGAYIDPATGGLVAPLGILSKGTLGIGYGTGAGGAVTQITDATTGVTINTPTGQITTVALSTAAAAEERFTVTNAAVGAKDVIAVSTTYAGAGTPAVTVTKVAAGAFDIVVTNLHASAALNALMVINFAVIKGATS